MEVLVQDRCAMRQRGVGVNRRQDDVVAAKKRGHVGAVGIPLRPVSGQAGDAGAVGFQFVQPAGEQRVHLGGTQVLEILPHPIAAIGAQQFHLQGVGLFEAGRAVFHEAGHVRSKRACRGADHGRDPGIGGGGGGVGGGGGGAGGGGGGRRAP